MLSALATGTVVFTGRVREQAIENVRAPEYTYILLRCWVVASFNYYCPKDRH